MLRISPWSKGQEKESPEVGASPLEDQGRLLLLELLLRLEGLLTLLQLVLAWAMLP